MFTEKDAPQRVKAVEKSVTSVWDLEITPFQQNARLWMTVMLVLVDFLSLFLAGWAAVSLRMIPGDLLNQPLYWTLIPILLIFIAVYALRGLYPAVGFSPVEELRRLTTSTSAVILVITGFTFWARTAQYYSRLVFAFAWILMLVFVPIGRWLLRIIAVRLGIWGEPVVVAGYGTQGKRIVEFLLHRMRFGLLPKLILVDTMPDPSITSPDPLLPILEIQNNHKIINFSGLKTVILITSELSRELTNSIVNHQGYKFHRLILISDLGWIGSMGVTPYDLEGLLGLEVRQNLLNPWERNLKRIVDVLISITSLIFCLPLFLVIAIMIKLDTKGGIFYKQIRMGRGNRPITIYKFRTMITDSEQILSEHLGANPEAQLEWEVSQKLKYDPRITRIGRFLRRYSVDELPQLWNVLKGDMSLVGPRPIMFQQVELYQKGLILYERVRPGITGLWQVSGRANNSFVERVQLDEYYVRNWSLWLDLYILLRTVWVVIRGEGAY